MDLDAVPAEVRRSSQVPSAFDLDLQQSILAARQGGFCRAQSAQSTQPTRCSLKRGVDAQEPALAVTAGLPPSHRGSAAVQSSKRSCRQTPCPSAEFEY